MKPRGTPGWLREHWRSRPYATMGPAQFSRSWSPEDEDQPAVPKLLADEGFNSHALNDGNHVSPYDTGIVAVGVDRLEVQLLQGVRLDDFQQVLARATRATTGLAAPLPDEIGTRWLSPRIEVDEEDWTEMMRGGLQAALESQTVVFEVWGASRALTHQLVRSRRAGFHQQSQRATWYGDRPEVRMPESIWRSKPSVRKSWMDAVSAAWAAYEDACDAGVSYQDARYILPEGTVNYIQCEYTVREFLSVYAYRGCSMFLWEMVQVMRAMRTALLFQSPWLEPYVKVSCENGAGCKTCQGSGRVWAHDGIAWDPSDAVPDEFAVVDCTGCGGTGGRKCTFQGWENVEGVCDRPMAKQSNRVFLPNPKFRIGEK